MFSQVYRWHSWGKEILLICPRWPSYVRGWTRIRTQRLSQMTQCVSYLNPIFYPGSHKMLEMAAVRIVRDLCVLLWSRQAVTSSSHLGKGAARLLHSKRSWRWAAFLITFSSSFSVFPDTTRHSSAHQDSPYLRNLYICRSNKKKWPHLRYIRLTFLTVKILSHYSEGHMYFFFLKWLMENTRHLI